MKQSEIEKTIGKTVVINGSGDLYMSTEARPFINSECILIKRCKSGLLLVAMNGLQAAFASKNVTVKKQTVNLTPELVAAFEVLIVGEINHCGFEEEDVRYPVYKDCGGNYWNWNTALAFDAFDKFMGLTLGPREHDFMERDAFARWLLADRNEEVSGTYNPYDDPRHELMYQAWDLAMELQNPE